MITIFSFILFVSITHVSKASTCHKGLVCVDLQYYQKCISTGEAHQLIGDPQSCPERHFCDNSTGSVICRFYPPATQQIELSDITIKCFGPIKHASVSSCYRYYECVPVLWWWAPKLKNCPKGEAFDTTVEECRSQKLVDCQYRGTTTEKTNFPSTTTTAILPTTTILPITDPKCKGPSKHPALFCYQYYECVKKLWWYEPHLKTCPKGKAFDRVTGTCVCAGLLNCVLPEGDLECDGPGTHPALSCQTYYECTKVLWWMKPVLKTCPTGQSYDTSICQCAPVNLVNCILPLPKCQGYAKYPAPLNNQYYECTLSESGVEWVPVLKTCEFGTIFSTTYKTCLPVFFPK